MEWKQCSRLLQMIPSQIVTHCHGILNEPDRGIISEDDIEWCMQGKAQKPSALSIMMNPHPLLQKKKPTSWLSVGSARTPNTKQCSQKDTENKGQMYCVDSGIPMITECVPHGPCISGWGLIPEFWLYIMSCINATLAGLLDIYVRLIFLSVLKGF